MILRPSVLCPIDFSESSRGALRYARAIAAHFAARLTVVAVDDPLLGEAAALSTAGTPVSEDTAREIDRFVRQTFKDIRRDGIDLRCETATGKPADEILRVSRERNCDLIVMSSHGLTGFRKMFFGSTTERVLRETTTPVLVTPPLDPGAISIEDASKVIKRVMVPVDLSPGSRHQAVVAAGLTQALGVPLILLHVIEPVRTPLATRLPLPGIEANRRAVAEEGLQAIAADLPARVQRETLIVYGDPAEELAKVIRDRQAGLVVIGLHASPLLGPRMGSVTYRMLCLSPTLVLALPPERVRELSAALSPRTAALS